MIMTFDTWGSKLPFIEIYGSEGTMNVPDPNYFGGPVYFKRKGAADWNEIPLLFGYNENSRGIGIADMAHSLRRGIEARANGEMAFHVIDVMQGIYDASASGSYYKPISSCKKPEALPLGFPEYVLDLQER
jgi:predicted dehydrogenase